ncbi:unnamed protein product [Rotaria sp. Silwood2]|nr:unnamed protein product [Rotaria sp. Silwood2]CAF4254025.1 unnamed protein product [Rotaria sp. Silwood2]
MRTFVSLIILLVFECARIVQSYPYGAPSSTCGSMMPSHGTGSMSCQSNYVIEANKYQYSSGDTIQITVRGATSSNRFKGILLVAKDTSGQNILGSWSSTDSSVQVISCSGTSSNGITQTSSTTKSQIQATWSAPSTISSTTLPSVSSTTTAGVPPTTTAGVPPTTTAGVPPTTTAGVPPTTTAGVPPTAIPTVSQSASTSIPSVDVITTITSQVPSTALNLDWTYFGGITTVTIVTNNLGTSQWFGIGLSLDNRMGDDHVFVCQRLNDDTIQLQRFINPGGYSSPTVVAADSNYGGTFKVSRVALNNGVAYCEFTLSNFTTTTGQRRKRSISLLSQSTQYRILSAVGSLDSSNSLAQHSSVSVQTQMIQLNELGTLTMINIEGSDDNEAIFLRAHAIIMLFIWMLFVSTGIIIARHFKQSWPTRKLCGKPIWFAVHRSIMIFAAIMTLTAFAAILKYKGGTWVSQSLSREFAHSIVGMLVVSAAIIQPIMALFRCHPDHQHRFIFNYAHAIIGMGGLVFSIGTIFLATLFTMFDSVMNKPWRILVAWSSTEFLILIGFECVEIFHRKHWRPFNPKIRDDPLQMNVLDNGSVTISVDDRSSPETILKERLKTLLLILHILVAFGLSLTLAYGTWQAS